MRKYYIIIFIVGVLIVSAGLYYFYLYLPSRFTEAFESAVISLKAGDSQGAIEKLNKALPLAQTKKEEATIKNYIASAYLTIDRARAVQMLKDVAADTSYPNLERAFAVQFIADAYMFGSRNVDFAKDNIFTGEPYSSFLPKNISLSESSKVKVYEGIRSIYEYALTFYQLPVAEYRLAERELRTVVQTKIGNPNARLAKPESEYVASAKEYLKKGNAALTDYISGVGGDNQIGYAYWVRGAVLGYLAELEKDSTYLPEAEEAFKSSLIRLRNSPSVSGQNLSLWASFYYAAFLEKHYKISRTDDIKKLLAYITEPKFKNLYFINYLGALGGLDRVSYDRESTLDLARLDPDFKHWLKNLGWKFK